MKSATDTSSISFTAHYTGYIWFHYQLSERAFATPRGRLYFQLLRPFEYLARGVIGTDIKTTLLQRHHLIDRELESLIAHHPDLQVLEIACGLSPRGHRFSRAHAGISYVEADLPGMVQRKQALLGNLHSLNERHRVIVCNILEQGEDSLESVIAREFDHRRPLVVITEGLVNYFELPTISGFWQRLGKLLKDFPLGVYLTDIYPSVQGHRFSGLIRAANESLRVASRSSFSLHFSADAEIEQHFDKLGYMHTQVFDPDRDIQDAKVPRAVGGAIVRVIAAQATV